MRRLCTLHCLSSPLMLSVYASSGVCSVLHDRMALSLQLNQQSDRSLTHNAIVSRISSHRSSRTLHIVCFAPLSCHALAHRYDVERCNESIVDQPNNAMQRSANNERSRHSDASSRRMHARTHTGATHASVCNECRVVNERALRMVSQRTTAEHT